MHYDPRKRNHNLPHDPFTALVVPRPIGWISTIGRDGIVNLAPYSFFNAVSSQPPVVMFSSATRKDSQRNAEDFSEFVHSLVTYEVAEQMNITSSTVGPEVSEPELAGLEMAPSLVVRPPRVKKSPVAFECRHLKTVEVPPSDGKPAMYSIVMGEIVSIYVDDSVIVDGRIDLSKMRPVARLGYLDDYCYYDERTVFKMIRPK
jgi:flavin reductase (DIM6/NTAB) family NADH-FMN oxidoreductase RutF